MASVPKRTHRPWVVLSMVAGLAVFAFYLYSFAGVDRMVSLLEKMNVYYYVLALFAVPMSVLCSSLSWHSLLSGLQVRISLWKAFLYSWVGEFVNGVVPGDISGDFFKAYLISKDSREDTGKVVASVVVQKLFSIAIVIVNLAAGLTLLTMNYGLQSEFFALSVVSITLLVALFIALVYFSVRPKATERVVGWIARVISIVRGKNWDKARFQESARKSLCPFYEGVQSIRGNRKALIKAAVFSSLESVFDISLVLLVFSALHYPIPVDKALIVFALTSSLQGSGVTTVGFTEVIMVQLYTTLQVGGGLGSTAQFALSADTTLLSRFASLWVRLAIAFVSFQVVVSNRCVRGVCQRVSARRSQAVPEEGLQEINPETTR